jgi:hypothetical protein
MMRSLVLLLCCFIGGCTTYKYLGSKQTSLAADACAIGEKQCFMSASSQSLQGRRTTVNGSYFLDNVGGGTYTFSGSVKLEYDDPTIKNIKSLDLTFIFFKGDLVVHEEKVRLKGTMGKYLKFSQLIKSDVVFESSKWAWYQWSANELGAF